MIYVNIIEINEWICDLNKLMRNVMNGSLLVINQYDSSLFIMKKNAFLIVITRLKWHLVSSWCSVMKFILDIR